MDNAELARKSMLCWTPCEPVVRMITEKGGSKTFTDHLKRSGIEGEESMVHQLTPVADIPPPASLRANEPHIQPNDPKHLQMSACFGRRLTPRALTKHKKIVDLTSTWDKHHSMLYYC
ncbi:hypothetical protein AVEN_195097-1 [Araneus ventricosus]|uniref:Uncharacterized protein n=1 Tax=Araneus ventricosus TaxID=182803 RepID=A0A4Y2BG61_ARAVE|nr:hypothetical protein AVEN_195097-1 [Araneus ventricosus]